MLGSVFWYPFCEFSKLQRALDVRFLNQPGCVLPHFESGALHPGQSLLRPPPQDRGAGRTRTIRAKLEGPRCTRRSTGETTCRKPGLASTFDQRAN